jgi:ribosomal protein S18 acetylase RimI-like enzyme
MIIRNAKLADVSAIAKIHVDGWQHAYREILPATFLEGLSYSKREVSWSKWISENKMTVYVAEENKTVIGYISGSKESDLAKLLGLYLNPLFIGKGVGKALLSHFENKIKAKTLVLMVLKGNTLGISFYGRNGFVFTGKTEDLQISGQCFLEQEMKKDFA